LALLQLRDEIPLVDEAVGDFNSTPREQPPYRDIPSIIVAAMTNPDIAAPEPDWTAILTYFLTRTPPHGLSNLQDLYMLLVRVVVPRAIIVNRHYMHVAYTRYPLSLMDNAIRYDAWGLTPMGRQHPGAIQVPFPAGADPRWVLPLHYTANIAPRSILRSRPTPDGNRFLQWLHDDPQPLNEHQPIPFQMAHQSSELDYHLTVPETTVRAMPIGELIRQTTRVLNIFWWLSGNNSQFREYMG
jgi:hypothetical protein